MAWLRPVPHDERVNNKTLFLHEELLLLALQDEKGSLFFGAMALPAIAGGVVAELLLRKKIELETVRKRQFVRLCDPGPMGDPILDQAVDRIRHAKRRATLQAWVGRVAGFKSLLHEVAGQLCDQGVLKLESKQVLLIFKRKVYPERDPRPEREIIQRLRSAIFSSAGDVEVRTKALVSLANGADFLKFVFDKKELKERTSRIDQIVNGEACGKATRDAIQAMQAAVMIAVMIPVVVSSTHH